MPSGQQHAVGRTSRCTCQCMAWHSTHKHVRIPRPHLNWLASKGVRKPSVPMAKHITGGSGTSSGNSDAMCLQQRVRARV